MSKLADPVLAAIESGYSTGGLSKTTAQAIFNTARLLRAARTLEDVSVFARVHPRPSGRFLVPVAGKWGISFQVAPDIGPNALRLEKLGKSWPEKRSRSSRPKRSGKS